MPTQLSTARATAIAGACLAGALVSAQVAVDPPGNRQPRPPTTARIAPLPEAQWRAEQREVVTTFERGGVADPGLRTLVRVPELARAIAPYTQYLVEASTLPERVRRLLILRTAWLTGSDAVWSRYASGLPTEERRRVAEGPSASGWSEGDRALLRTADELYRLSSVTNATWKSISAAFDLHGVIDVVETVNHFTTLALVYNSIGVQPGTAADRMPRGIAYRVAIGQREPPLREARIAPAEGTGIAVGRTFARHPKLNAVRGGRANFILRVSPLQPRHREMLILRTGWNAQSEYEWAQHVGNVGRARDYGLEPVNIAKGPDAGWDAFEAAILRAADELYRDSVVSDATWKTLAGRFDEAAMMSAVFTASSYRATAMALNAFGVQLEPGDERFPQLAAK
jgi:4-carboxymuconolactone decarboxylase